MRRECILTISLLCMPFAAGADDTLDWLLQTHATTAPATQPAEQSPAVSPLVKPGKEQSVAGEIILSTGETIAGDISTTPGKPLRIWAEEERQYYDVNIADIREIRASVLWEREEREWHFIASGSDIKEYTDKTYPARETQYTFVLRDGKEVTGGVAAPLYVQTPEGQQRFILHKRNKGQAGETLNDLVYVKMVRFSDRNTP